MTLLEFCEGDRELASLWTTNIRRSFVFDVIDRDVRLYLGYYNGRNLMANRDAPELLEAPADDPQAT